MCGWWKFNEGTGTLTTDSSGNGNTGTLTGIPTWTTGVASNALDLDGVNDYVNVGNKSTLQSNPTWTFAGWVNPDTFNSTRDTYLFYKDSVLLWGFRAATSRQLTVNIGSGNGGNPWQGDTTSSVQLNAGGWTHVAVTYTNSTVRFYVNGTLTNTFSKTYTMGSKNSAFTISTSAQSFDGKLDDMRYYNRALSDGEVAQVYGEQATGSNSVYLADALGSVVALADSNKTIQTWYGYEPFGQSTSHGSPTTNPFTFTGREDDGTGMYYYRARCYQPVLGRFIDEDPIDFAGGDINLYAFVLGNPVMRRDPSGESWVSWVGAAVVAEMLLHAYLADEAFKVFPEQTPDQDRQRHCWVNCVSTRIHLGSTVPAELASDVKELRDLAVGAWKGEFWKTVKDSVGDEIANLYGRAVALNIFKSCEEQCKECPTKR